MSRSPVNERGATLIELLFSIAIMLVLTTSYYRLLVSFHESYQTQDAIAEMQQQGRVALDLLSGEIGLAGYDPTGTAFKSKSLSNNIPVANALMTQCINETTVEPMMEASATVVHFLADLNDQAGGAPDGDFVAKDSLGSVVGGDPGEDIRYEWVGASGKNSCGQTKTPYTLYRNTGGGAQEVATNIEFFELTYFDETGMPLTGNLDSAQRAAIRKVIIKITAGIDPVHKSINKRHSTRKYAGEIWMKNM